MRFGLVALAIVALLALGCSDTGNKTAEKQRKESVELRARTFSHAESLFPAPQPENFPLRQALIEYTKRQDMLNHPWFIYVLGENGNPIGYFTGKTYPQNICNFLSSTEEVANPEDGAAQSVVLTAPSLDGVYYGGGGAKGTCDAWFFFDAATNAMQVISGLPYFVSDAPLALNVQPIRVQGQ